MPSKRAFGNSEVGRPAPHPATPAAALALLESGNDRYRSGKLELRDHSPVAERAAEAQEPFAALITCADSRLSPELIFDVSGGNLFVSRVAGNTIDVGTLGSTEYAVAVLGVKVVMILGHSNCGAVKAAIEVAAGKQTYPPKKYGAIGPVVDEILPAVKSVSAGNRTVEHCVTANAKTTAKQLAAQGPIIKPAVDSGRLRVVPAVYDIADARVTLV